MARIRTIKPEFWTSEQIVECSTSARLLFIGLWNFCDDGGVHPASIPRLKMEVLPGDPFTFEEVGAMVTELETAGLLVEFEHGGSAYWYVSGWHHQKIDRPTMKHPGPLNEKNYVEISSRHRRDLDELSPPGREGKGREGTGMDINPPTPREGSVARGTEKSRSKRFGKAKPRKTRKPKYSEAFEAFWATYPPRNGVKVGKPGASTEFDNIDPGRHEDLSRATEHLVSAVAAGQLPKDAKRWLRIDPKTGSAPWEEWVNQTDAGTVPREKSAIDLWREKEGIA